MNAKTKRLEMIEEAQRSCWLEAWRRYGRLYEREMDAYPPEWLDVLAAGYPTEADGERAWNEALPWLREIPGFDPVALRIWGESERGAAFPDPDAPELDVWPHTMDPAPIITSAAEAALRRLADEAAAPVSHAAMLCLFVAAHARAWYAYQRGEDAPNYHDGLQERAAFFREMEAEQEAAGRSERRPESGGAANV